MALKEVEVSILPAMFLETHTGRRMGSKSLFLTSLACPRAQIVVQKEQYCFCNSLVSIPATLWMKTHEEYGNSQKKEYPLKASWLSKFLRLPVERIT